ncbi:hypothetical protein AB1Y20_004846 [Prymnesium parvum]|uniref:non-specific serine/threonine protein kinase n=1 Tax=Prymnesium parvum TaxID=97485 RepID=A0AB34IXN0_PRYPA
MSWFGKVVKGIAGSAGTIIQFDECQVVLTSLLAEGGYSYVYSAREVGIKGRQFAAKKVLSQDAETRAVAETEIKLLKKFNGHSAFVGCYGTTSKSLPKNQDEYWMLLEFCPNGSLIDLLFRKNKKGDFEKRPELPTEKILEIIEQVAAGIAHMHSFTPPIAHRDLKLENVLGAADGRYVLCDFGSATTSRLEVERTRQQIVVEEERIHKYSTLMYRAPEMCDLYREAEVGEMVDCWALGCILFALCFGDHPFDSASMLQILNAAYTIPEAHSRPPQLVALVEALLHPDPIERLSAAEAVEWVGRLRVDAQAERREAPERRARREAQREEQRRRRAAVAQGGGGAAAKGKAKREGWSADFSAVGFEGFDEIRPAVERWVCLTLTPRADGTVGASCVPAPRAAVAQPAALDEQERLPRRRHSLLPTYSILHSSPHSSLHAPRFTPLHSWEASFDPSFQPSFASFEEAEAPSAASVAAPPPPVLPPPPSASTLPPPPTASAVLPQLKLPRGASAAPSPPPAPLAADDDEFGDFSSCDPREDAFGDFTPAAPPADAPPAGEAPPGSPATDYGDFSRPTLHQRESTERSIGGSDDFGEFAGAPQEEGDNKDENKDEEKVQILGGNLD